MKTCWLHHQGNHDCILFMAGWGMCPEPFQDIPSDGTDVLIVYDYRNLNINPVIDFLRNSQYQKLHLLAWSMGVWTAAMISENNELFRSRLTTTTALGGTCHPIHDTFGIPEHQFVKMMEQLSPVHVKEFYDSMFDKTQEAERFLSRLQKKQRSAEKLQQELHTLCKAVQNHPDLLNIFENRIVTVRDRVFPARNQIRAWGRHNCTSLSLPHFPFYHWSNWAEIIAALT
jgi:biotin synthesis protein BioG